MSNDDKRCPWTIRYGTSGDTTARCTKDEHMDGVRTREDFIGHAFDLATADLVHEGDGLYEGQVVRWYAGDRREYTGEWPGYCQDNGKAGCNLPRFHLGDHAP